MELKIGVFITRQDADINLVAEEQQKFWKLVLEVRAKNGMTQKAMSGALRRLRKAGIISEEWS